MEKIALWLITFLIVLFASLVSPSLVKSQEVSLSLTPLVAEVIAKPGSSGRATFTLINGPDPATVLVKLLPAEARDTYGLLTPIDSQKNPFEFSLDGDVQLNEPFFLKSGEKRELNLTIRAAQEIDLKDYYYLFLVEFQPPPVEEGRSSIGIKATTGSNLLISVTKSQSIELKPTVALFTINSGFKLPLGTRNLNLVDSFDTVQVVLTVENKGSYRIKPEGRIIMRTPLGTKSLHQIDPQFVLSHSQRLLSAHPSVKSTTPATFTARGFFLGFYDLNATVTFGPGTPTLYTSTSFLALPFKLFAFIIVAVIGGYLFLTKIVNS